MKRTGLLTACVLFATNGMLWGLTADDLVRTTGIAGGLCSFPRVAPGDEKLAFELAKRPTFVVHMLSTDAQVAARLGDSAEAEGVLGRSLYVEKGGATLLPFVDRLVDLLVVTDLRDADLTDELRSEFLRVLAPRRGAALVGRAKEAGPGLSQQALKAWTKGLSLAKVTAESPAIPASPRYLRAMPVFPSGRAPVAVISAEALSPAFVDAAAGLAADFRSIHTLWHSNVCLVGRPRAIQN